MDLKFEDMKTKKILRFRLMPVLVMMAAFLMVSLPADAQSRTGRRRAQTKRTTTSARLKAPATPTPISVRERTIQDLLFFPFASLPDNLNTLEKTQEQLTATFGQCESVSMLPGLHAHDTFDFTYRDVPLGLAFYDWSDNRMWYDFYFEAKADAERFYRNLCNDIKNVGIPLTYDKIYGGLSNRTRPVAIFKWVYVNTPEKVKIIEGANTDSPHLKGWYKVELGVYKRAR